MSEILNYKDIEVNSPYELVRLLKLEIINEVNEHAKLKYEGIVSEENRHVYVLNSKYKDKIEVKTKDGEILFVGEQATIEVKAEGSNYHLIVEALSYTYNMDIDYKKRSYQENSMTYDDMIRSVIKDYNKADFINTVARGETLNKLSLQFMESDWNYLKRMASRYESVLISESRHDSPKFWFGLPEGSSYELNEIDYVIKKNASKYREAKERYKKGVKETSYVEYEIESKKNMYLGDNVLINDIPTKVLKSELKMEEGVLIIKYTLKAVGGIRNDLLTNDIITGLSLEGKVLERKGNEIKIKLDIDRNSPDCGTRWFKYESNYVTGENYGWYVMPGATRFSITI